MSLAAHMIVDEDALRAIEPEWWGLWRVCPAATPFQSPAWVLPWWSCFHPGPLRVATVRSGGALVAIVPLYREDGAQGRRLLPLGISLSDYLDVLVAPAQADAAWRAIEALYSGFDLHWSTIAWDDVAPGAEVLQPRHGSGWRRSVSQASACPVLALPERAENLSGAVPPTKLRKLRMARRRAERRTMSVEPATGPTLAGLLEALFHLHGDRWQARGEAGVLADDDVRRFHRLAAPRLLAAGLLRFMAVRLDGAVAGAYYGFAHRGRAYAYLGGFDPAFAFESPGTLLMGEAIEQAMGEGAREFHFLRGQEGYKYEWGATDRLNSRLTVERGDG